MPFTPSTSPTFLLLRLTFPTRPLPYSYPTSNDVSSVTRKKKKKASLAGRLKSRYLHILPTIVPRLLQLITPYPVLTSHDHHPISAFRSIRQPKRSSYLHCKYNALPCPWSTEYYSAPTSGKLHLYEVAPYFGPPPFPATTPFALIPDLRTSNGCHKWRPLAYLALLLALPRDALPPSSSHFPARLTRKISSYSLVTPSCPTQPLGTRVSILSLQSSIYFLTTLRSLSSWA